MRTTPALDGLLAMLALPCAAHAAPVVKIGQGVSWDLKQPGALTWKIKLAAGHDYAVSAGGDEDIGQLTLRGPGGRVLAQFPFDNYEEFHNGREFRAPVSAYYFVTVSIRIVNPEAPGGWLTVGPDCLGSTATRCTLPVGDVRIDRPYNWSNDSDWYRTTLSAGTVYRATLDTADYETLGVMVHDALGAFVAPVVSSRTGDTYIEDFVVPSSGTYFVETSRSSDGTINPYTLSLALAPAPARR